MENKLSVSDLNSYIKGVFDDELVLHNLSVYGELFQYSISGNNTYFTLKENDCYLQCVCFGRIEKPEIGTQITVFGSVDFYRKAGKVTFIAKKIEETGKGKQYAEFLAMKEKLSAEGLFINKCTMPSFIRKVAIVTSNRGAVIHDFLSVLSGKHSYIDINVIQTKVQGENADDSLSCAIADADSTNADVIVIARGGGSASDLDCFNSEKVVRAVASCKTPTISAVGHQTDYTLCDLASTHRSGTPSIAGEAIAKINEAVLLRFYDSLQRIDNALKSKYNKSSSLLYTLSSKIINSAERNYEKQTFKIRSKLDTVKNCCVSRLKDNEHKIRNEATRQLNGINKKYLEFDKKLALSATKLEFSNPMKILSQGYAVISKNNESIRTIEKMENGDLIKIRLYDGQVFAEVKEIKK